MWIGTIFMKKEPSLDLPSLELRFNKLSVVSWEGVEKIRDKRWDERPGRREKGKRWETKRQKLEREEEWDELNSYKYYMRTLFIVCIHFVFILLLTSFLLTYTICKHILLKQCSKPPWKQIFCNQCTHDLFFRKYRSIHVHS